MEGQIELLDYLSSLEAKGIDILEYIPIGHEKAVSRQTLSRIAGISDREVRRLIHKARRDNVILNMQDGSGYFRPDMQDPDDVLAVQRYVKQEESRIKSIGWALKPARKALK